MSSGSGLPGWWTRLVSPDDAGPDTGGEPSAAEQAEQAKEAEEAEQAGLWFMEYFWWLVVAAVGEIVFGGMYLGGVQVAGIDVSTPWAKLIYVLLGIVLMSLAQGILRLEAWVPWAALIVAFGLLGLSGWEIFRFVTGASATWETKIFDVLNILFALLAIYLALQPALRSMFAFAPFQSGQFSPRLTIFASVLLVLALAIALEVNDVDTHLRTPVLALVYLLGFALMIVIGFATLGLQTWTWVAAWLCTAVLLGLSIDVIVRRLTGNGVNVQGLIVSIVNILVVANVVYYLLRRDVRQAFLGRRPKQALFYPAMLIAGLLVAVAALVAYLLPGELGTPAVAYTVLGLAVGVVVGLLPHANPVAQLFGFVLGLLLAFASFVVRGGLLPYTKLSSALVVLLLLVIITGITALFRSSAWFVSMLLGVGILYGVVEVTFQAAPSAYLATSTVALISILFGSGIGYGISALLGLRLAPASGKHAEGSQTGAREPEAKDTQPDAEEGQSR